MSTNVSFEGANGNTVGGRIAEPSGSGKAPAVILIQEWWGLNDHIESIVDRLATEGFLVIAPDLYHGKIAKDADEAAELMTALDTMEAMTEIGAAAVFAKKHARCNGKVGVMGFCMGGALTFAAACHVEGLSAAVPFYGVPPAEKVDYKKVTAPILAHFSKPDQWATVEKAEAVKAELDAQHKPMQLEVYDAQHAFMNDTRPEVYDEKCAKLAWQRTVDFLNKHLA
jgi:carboxymethylenebutenolidase